MRSVQNDAFLVWAFEKNLQSHVMKTHNVKFIYWQEDVSDNICFRKINNLCGRWSNLGRNVKIYKFLA